MTWAFGKEKWRSFTFAAQEPASFPSKALIMNVLSGQRDLRDIGPGVEGRGKTLGTTAIRAIPGVRNRQLRHFVPEMQWILTLSGETCFSGRKTSAWRIAWNDPGILLQK